MYGQRCVTMERCRACEVHITVTFTQIEIV